MKQTVLSGVQASGLLHIGNYLGAVKGWVEMQEGYKCLFFLADLHAITVDQEPVNLKNSIISCAALYIACGLEPKKSIIFPQSMVSAHSELAWIFNCICPMGALKRMTQFKDKSKKQDNINLGLFAYPVLMAADILLYKADLVPTGEDQKQHLELTRDIAGIINKKLNVEVFKLPQALIEGPAARIMSLKDGTSKMSKSDTSDASRINLTDTNDVIYDKIKRAKTDSVQGISYDLKSRPEITNLVNMYSALCGLKSDLVIDRYATATFSKFKDDLAGVIIEKLEPIRIKYGKLMQNKDYIIDAMRQGAEKAQNIADKTLKEVKELMGFVI